MRSCNGSVQVGAPVPTTIHTCLVRLRIDGHSGQLVVELHVLLAHSAAALYRLHPIPYGKTESIGQKTTLKQHQAQQQQKKTCRTLDAAESGTPGTTITASSDQTPPLSLAASKQTTQKKNALACPHLLLTPTNKHTSNALDR